MGIIEAFVAFDTAKLRNAVAIAEAGPAGEVRFLGEIENTGVATAKLVRKLAAQYGRLTFCYEGASAPSPRGRAGGGVRQSQRQRPLTATRKAASRRPSMFWSMLCFVQATVCAFRFLRHPSRPNTPRPVAKSGRAAGSGVGAVGLISPNRPPTVPKSGTVRAAVKNSASESKPEPASRNAKAHRRSLTIGFPRASRNMPKSNPVIESNASIVPSP
jgi:hypothetical protein